MLYLAMKHLAYFTFQTITDIIRASSAFSFFDTVWVGSPVIINNKYTKNLGVFN